MIIWFGINRDGLTRVLRYSFQANVVVHCGVGTNETQIDWFFSNGTKVGIMNRNIREGHFQNGTALLHIGSTRRLNLCDAGVYTCVANTSGHVERKNFTLIVNSESKNAIICHTCNCAILLPLRYSFMWQNQNFQILAKYHGL